MGVSGFAIYLFLLFNKSEVFRKFFMD